MALCPFYPEAQVGYTCNKGSEIRGKNCTIESMLECLAIEWTCTDCGDKNTCNLAFDPYNTDGDCLAMK